MGSFKYEPWRDFCNCYQIVEEGVPLFQTEDNAVAVREVGRTKKRLVLARSSQMENDVIREVN